MYFHVQLKSKADQIKGIEAAADIAPVQCYPEGKIIVNSEQLKLLEYLGLI